MKEIHCRGCFREEMIRQGKDVWMLGRGIDCERHRKETEAFYKLLIETDDKFISLLSGVNKS